MRRLVTQLLFNLQFHSRGDANRLHCKYISSDLTIYENFIILVKNDSRLIET